MRKTGFGNCSGIIPRFLQACHGSKNCFWSAHITTSSIISFLSTLILSFTFPNVCISELFAATNFSLMFRSISCSYILNFQLCFPNILSFQLLYREYTEMFWNLPFLRHCSYAVTVGVGLVCENVTSAIYMSLMFLLYSTFLFILLLFLFLSSCLFLFRQTVAQCPPVFLQIWHSNLFAGQFFTSSCLFFPPFMTFVTLRVILISILFINFFDVKVAR